MKRWFIRKIKEIIPNTYEYLLLNKNEILKSFEKKRKVDDLIVSLTTYEPRLKVFEYSILSILGGTLLPEKILIYVPKGFIDLYNKYSDSFLKSYIDNKYIFLIEMERDLGPHSKYYYSFLQYGSDKDIVVCDDDVVYYRYWLEGLYKNSQEYIDYNVIAYKVVNVKVDNNIILPYDEWIHLNRRVRPINNLLYAEGVGGVFYRRKSIINEVLNKEVFMKVAPKADDVWLWFCVYFNNGNVKHINTKFNMRLLFVVPASQIVNLWEDNTINKRNDDYVRQCQSHFKINHNFEITKFI